MKPTVITSIAILTLILGGCKIQNAPGAYLPAQGRVEVGSLEPEQLAAVEGPAPMPKPTPIVVETPEPEPEPEYVEEPEPVKDIEEPKQEETVPENVRQESFSVVDEPDIVLKKYHLVIGSFGQKTNAQNLQKQMRPQYDPVIVINDRGLYRVILISYDTYSETKAKIATLRDQFPDAWVLMQK